jgi:autotransporter-associated beta strand protein
VVTVSGGILNLTNVSEGIGTLNQSGGTVTGSSTLTVTNVINLTNGTIAEILAGAASLTQSGSGTTLLTASNSFGGGVFVSAGALVANNSNALASGTVTLSGGVLNITNYSETVGLFTIGSGSLIGSSTLTATNGYQLNGGLVSANLGTGTITVGGSSTLSGTAGASVLTITNGTLFLNAGNLLTNAPAVAVSNGVVLNLGGFNEILSALTGTGTVTNGANTLTVNVVTSTNDIFGGVLQGGGALTIGGMGTFTMTGSNSYTGGTFVNAGTLVASNSNALAGGAVTVSGGILNITNLSETIGLLTIGSGSLIGSATLTATNGYQFNGGTVGANLGIGTITVGGSSTLSGSSAATVLTITNGVFTLSGLLTNTPTVTVSGGQFVVNSSNTFGAVNLGNGTISGTGTLSSASGLTVTNTGAALFSNNLAGAGSLVQSGSGTTTVWGNNSYTGGTYVTNGTLKLGSGTALGLGSLTIESILDLTGFSITQFGLSGSGTITNSAGAATLTLNTTNSFNFAGSIVSNITLVIGSGTQTLSGSNSYTGGTFVTNGTLVASNTYALASGTVTVSGGLLNLTNVSESIATLNLGGGTVTGTSTLTVTNAINLTNSGTVLISEILAGSASLTQSGAGTTTLTVSNSFGSGVFVSGGTLVASNTNALASGTVTVSGGTLNLTNVSESIASLNLGGGTVTGGSTLTVSGAISVTNGTIAEILAGSASLSQSGAGTTLLTASNSFGSGVFVSAGTLVASNSNALAGGNVTVSGGTLSVTNVNETIAQLTISGGALGGSATLTATSGYQLNGGTVSANLGTGTITVGNSSTLSGSAGASALIITNGTLTLTGLLTNTPGVSINGGTLALTGADTITSLSLGNGTVSGGGTLSVTNAITLTNSGAAALSGNLTGSGSLVQNGGGTTTLTGSNTYGGGTFLNAGTFAAGAANVLVTNGALSITNAVLNLGGYSETVGVVTLGSGTIQNGILSSSGYDLISGTVTAVLRGGGIVTKDGSGTVILTAANTYSNGMVLNAGTLQISNNAAFGTGTVTVASNSTVIQPLTSLTVTNAYLLNANALFNVASGLTLNNSGVISGTGGLTDTNTGTLILSGANTYSGGTFINGGSTIQVGNAGTNGTLGTSGVTNSGALVFNRTDSSLVSNVISGAGTLTQAGTGTTILSGANTYTGPTFLTAGVLSSSNAAAFGSSTVTFAATSTLQSAITQSMTNALVVSNGITGTIDVVAGTTLTDTAGISGGGNISKSTNGGTLIFAANNTYSGTTTVGAGTLQIGNGSTTGSFGYGAVINNGVLAFNFSTGMTITNTITGTGSIINLTTNTLLFTGTNTFSGGVTFNGGYQTVSNSTSLGNGTITFAANNTTLLDVATVTLTNSIVIQGSATATLDVATNLTLTLNGVISGGGQLVKDTNTGTLTLNGLNTYSGGTLLQGGLVQVSKNNAFGVGTVTMVDGASLWSADTASHTLSNSFVLSGIVTIGGIGANSGVLNLTGPVNLSTNTTFNVSGSTAIVTVSGPISGNSSFTMGNGGLGSLYLYGSNSYTGGTFVSSGLLYIGTNTALPNNQTVGVSGGILNLGSTTNTIGTLNLTGGVVTNGTLSGTYFNLLTGSISANLIGSGSLTMNGATTVTVSGANSYTGGTYISSGTLLVGNNSALGATNGLLSLNGGILNLGGYSDKIGTLVLNNGLITNGTLTGTNFSVGNGTITASLAGTGVLTMSNGSGTVTLGSGNSYTGGTLLSAGYLQLLAYNALGSGSVSITGGIMDLGGLSDTIGAFTINGGTITNGSLTASNYNLLAGGFYATVSGNGTLTKSSSGTLTLGGSSSAFYGTAIVNQGDMIINSTNVLANGELNLNGGTAEITSATATNYYIGGLTGSNNLLMYSNSIIIDGTVVTNANTYSGIISGSGSLSVTAGSLTLANSNTFTGGVFVGGQGGGGTVTLATNSAIVVGSTVTVANGVFNLGNYSNALGAVVVTNYPYYINPTWYYPSGTFNFGGASNSIQSLTMVTGTFNAGTNVIPMSFINDNSGNINGSNGASFTVTNYVNITAQNNSVTVGPGLSGSASLTISAPYAYNYGYSVTLNGYDNYTGPTYISGQGGGYRAATFANSNSLTGLFTVSSGDVYFNNSGANRNIFSNSTFVVTNTGRIYFQNTAEYITNSTFNMNGAGVYFQQAGNIVNAGFNLNNGSQLWFQAASNTITGGSMNLTNSAVWFQQSGNTIVENFNLNAAQAYFQGSETISGSILATNGSTVQLTSSNTLTGPVKIDNGTLLLANNNALGTSSLTLSNSTLTLQADALNISNAVTLGGSFSITTNYGVVSGTFSGPVTFTTNVTVYNYINTFSILGNISGNYSLSENGTGTLVLGGTNTYTGGTYINSGVLEMLTLASIPTNGQILIGSNGSLLDAGAFSNLGAWLSSGLINTNSAGALLMPTSESNAVSYANYPFLYLASAGSQTFSGVLTPYNSNGLSIYNFGGGSGTLTITSQLTNSPAVINIGDGHTLAYVNLENTNNTFSGYVYLNNNGNLVLLVPGSLGSNSTISFNGGTLQYGAPGFTVGDYSGQVAPLSNGITANINIGGNNVTYTNIITGSGNLNLSSGSGTLTANAGYGGFTEISPNATGTFNVNYVGTNIGGGAVYSYGGIMNFTVATNAFLNGVATVGYNTTLNLMIQNNQTMPGVQIINEYPYGYNPLVVLSSTGNNTLTINGNVNVNAGSLHVTNMTVLFNPTTSGSTASWIVDSGKIYLNAAQANQTINLTLNNSSFAQLLTNNQMYGYLTLNGSNSLFDMNGYNDTMYAANGVGIVTNSGASNSTLTVTSQGATGVLLTDSTNGGTLGLVIAGGGASFSNTNNNFRGGITITGGALYLGSTETTATNSILLSGGTLSVSSAGGIGFPTLTFNGGTLYYAGQGTTVGDLSSRFAQISNGITAYVNTDTNTVTYATTLSGPGAFDKSGGAGILNATGNYVGLTEVQAGTLNMNYTGTNAGGGTTYAVGGNLNFTVATNVSQIGLAQVQLNSTNTIYAQGNLSISAISINNNILWNGSYYYDPYQPQMILSSVAGVGTITVTGAITDGYPYINAPYFTGTWTAPLIVSNVSVVYNPTNSGSTIANWIVTNGSLYLGDTLQANVSTNMTLNSSFVQLQTSNQIGGLLTLNGSNSTLDMHGYSDAMNNISASNGMGIITNSGSSAATLSLNQNTILGSLLTDAGGGSLTLRLNGANSSQYFQVINASNNYRGGTILNVGILQLGGANNLGTGGFTITNNGGAGISTLQSATASAVSLTNTLALQSSVTLGGGGGGALLLQGAVVMTGATPTITVNSPVTVSGAISGSNGMTLNGSSTFTFAGNNTYNGPLTISALTVVACHQRTCIAPFGNPLDQRRLYLERQHQFQNPHEWADARR